MNKVDVSIVIPVYNVEKYLSKCIASVLAQTYKDFELILVDDGSPDNCGAICDEYAKKDSRIKVIHKENGGVSSARNAGIKIAQGEFINFVDSDDTIPVDSLENLVNLQKDNNSDLVCCTYEQHNINGTVKIKNVVDRFIDFSKIEAEDCKIFLSSIFFGPCVKLFNNNILKKHDILFDENISMGEDTKFVYDYLLKCGKVQCGSAVVYRYLKNDQSATTKSYPQFYDYIIKVSSAQIAFFNNLNIDENVKLCCNTNIALTDMEIIANHYITHYSYDVAIEVIEKAFIYLKQYFIKRNNDVAKFIEDVNGDGTYCKAYSLLSSKNGLKKYCKYKINYKKFNNFKAKLKKIKVVKCLVGLVKGK